MTNPLLEIISGNQCIGCGTCAGMCPAGCISLKKQSAHLIPIIDDKKCINCNICTKVCPGRGWNSENTLLNHEFNEKYPYLGNIIASYIGFSNDEKIRYNSASGGIITEFLIYLIENNYIDGVVASRMKKDSPLEGETIIARTREEILSCQKSIYCPVPAGTIISEILKNEGKYAFVGLPCHIAGLKKAQEIHTILNNRIFLTIGLFCSRTPNYNATLNLLNNMDVRVEDIQKIEYRGAGHPGKFSVKLKNGNEKSVDHLDYRYWGYTFLNNFKPLRCWLCHDHSAMLADMSCADNWIKRGIFKEDRSGSTMIVVRNQLVKEILMQMVSNERIYLEKIPSNSIAQLQNLPQKSDVAPRTLLMKLLGKSVPENYPVFDENISIKKFAVSLFDLLNIRLTNSINNQHLLNTYIRFSYILHKLLSIQIIPLLKRNLSKIINFLRTVTWDNSVDLRQEKPQNKIVIMGGFGWKDIGDEAMPHGVIYNFRKHYSKNELDIVMLSPDPEFTEFFHKERAINELQGLSFSRNGSFFERMKVAAKTFLFLYAAYMQKYNIRVRLWPNARKVLDEIATATLLFNNGGGNLNSIMPSELYKKCTLYLAAKILKKPVIISGQTIGPLTKWYDRFYARFCIDQVDFISFRDKEVSHNRLMDIGVKKPIMIDAADDAMTIPTILKDDALELIRSEAPPEWLETKSDHCIVMNMKGSMAAFQESSQYNRTDEIITIMATISDNLIEKYHAKIFYLPTDYSAGVDDRELHKKIIQRMKNQNHVFSIENEYDDSTLKGIISTADFAIGSRYHFCVFAASEYVPFFGIADGLYQNTKLKGLADLCDLEQCHYKEELSLDCFNDIWGSIGNVFTQKELVLEKLHEKVPILNEMSKKGVNEAIQRIERNFTK